MSGAVESSAGASSVKTFLKLGQFIPKLKLTKTLHGDRTNLLLYFLESKLGWKCESRFCNIMPRHKPHYKPGLKSVLPIDSPHVTAYFSQITRQFRSVQNLVELAEGPSLAVKWQGKYTGFAPSAILLLLSLQTWPSPNFQADDSTGQNLTTNLQ